MSEVQPPAPPPSPDLPPHLYAQPAASTYAAPTPWATPPRVRSTEAIATAALVAAGAVLLLTAVMAVASFDAAQKYEEAVARGERAVDVVTFYDILGLPLFGAQLLAWVLTAVWLGQARTNLANIRPGFHFRRSPAWDWLGWIVPIVSLWFPFQIVRDLSRGSSRTFTRYPMLGLWWGLWLAGMILGQSSVRLTLGSSADSSFDVLPIFDTISAVVWAGALILWVRIVRSIVRDQDAAAAAVTPS